MQNDSLILQEKTHKTISIVMCTYNGAQFVRQQIETLLTQTYKVDEIIIQDDNSTDNTYDILLEYAARYPHIHLYRNEKTVGANNNFYSAMRRAKSEYIAISDQDDIWDVRKIEKQMATIGDKLLCACRSCPFSSDDTVYAIDSRTPNYHLIRLLYCSIPGHTLLFHRNLLQLTPVIDDTLKTYYDVYLGLTAAAYGSLALTDEFLVRQRRHQGAATYMEVDKHRRPSVSNGMYILLWSLRNFIRVRPYMLSYFQRRYQLLSGIKADNKVFNDALKIIDLQRKKRLTSLFGLCAMHVKYRHYLFYAEGHGVVNFLRAALYCIMQTYNYKYLMPPTSKG